MNTRFVARFPKTFDGSIVFFSNSDNCLDLITTVRWPNGVCCHHCGDGNVTLLDRVTRKQVRTIWQCNGCLQQFSATMGTVFEDSKLAHSSPRKLAGTGYLAQKIFTGSKLDREP